MTTGNSQEFDAIIIGAGQGGKPLAVDLAGAGWKAALIEREHLGGTCVNTGCTPTKTMVASARVAHLAQRGESYGVQCSSIDIDMVKIRDRKRKIVESFRSGSEKLVEQTEGLTLFRGEGRFISEREVEVSSDKNEPYRLTSSHIFIDAGTRPRVPPIDGLESVSYLDSTTIMELDHVPEHLIVMGGGYVGLEFGQMFHRFGSRVTIVERAGQLMGREDKDVASALEEILSDEGIDIVLNATVNRVSQQSDGSLELALKSDNSESSLTGSHLLVASGRIPNSDLLNLDAAGIETDERGFIKCDDRLETNVEGVYVIGDVKGGPAFTHISYDDYRVLKNNLLEGGNASISGRLLAYTVFTDPQLGRAGLTEAEAKSQGGNVKVAKLPMTHVARALETDETRGVMKAVVDDDSKQILGCAILGPEGGEVMNMLHIAMMGRLPYTVLRDAALAHPTFGESLNNLFMSIDS